MAKLSAFILLISTFSTLALSTPLTLRQTGPVQCKTCSTAVTCASSTVCMSSTGLAGSTTDSSSYCACEPGFKAAPHEVGADPTAQWRLPWAGMDGRVFVRPDVSCGYPCDEEGCGEILMYDQCA